MGHWLVKSDPSEYSAADLQRDGHTAWDGVRNALAQKHIQAMQVGDEVFVYHSGKEKSVVAIATVGGQPHVDPDDASGKLHVVDLRFRSWFARPVSLKEIKDDSSFENFDLVRMSRLSVMPVPDALWKRLLKMGGGTR